MGEKRTEAQRANSDSPAIRQWCSVGIFLEHSHIPRESHQLVDYHRQIPKTQASRDMPDARSFRPILKDRLTSKDQYEPAVRTGLH